VALTIDEIRAAPKVLLHDHLDGGLRAATVVDLARQIGYDRLPSEDADEVKLWMQRGANRGHLNLYLDAFQHTVAVMQTRQALIRVAAECAEDLAADGVVYAEVRFAPELHVAGGLSLDEVVEAVLEGFRAGSEGRRITVYALLTAMRTAARSLEIAELAVRHRDQGVVGFDIAGAEAAARRAAISTPSSTWRGRTSTSRSTPARVRAPSIWEALQWCGAERLGHGVRIMDDIRSRRRAPRRWAGWPVTSGPADPAGDVPDVQRPDRGRALDRGAPDPAAAPAVLPGHRQHRQPADERGTPVLGVPPAGGGVRVRLADIEWLTINAMKSAFAHFDERLRIIDTVVKPGYATARATSDAVVRLSAPSG
jgi:adenosine deaminase